MSNLNQEAIDRLVELGKQTFQPFHLPDRKGFYRYAVPTAENSVQVLEIEKPEVPVIPEFSNLGDFCTFVEHGLHIYAGGERAIYVSPEKAVAAPFLIDENRPIARLPLHQSEPYRAMLRLLEGVDQRTAWRLFIAELSEAVPPDLAATIMNIEARSQAMANSAIDEVGLEETKTERKQGLSGSAAAKLPKDWTFTLPIFDLQDEPAITIKARLEIDLKSETQLRWWFDHAAIENQAVEGVKARIIEALGADPDIMVYMAKI